MMYEKTNWDYFCQLLAVIPGLSTMFDDNRDYVSSFEASDAETREAEARLRARGKLAGGGLVTPPPGLEADADDRERSVGESLEEGARSAAEAVLTGAEKVGDAVRDGLENAREFFRERLEA